MGGVLGINGRLSPQVYQNRRGLEESQGQTWLLLRRHGNAMDSRPKTRARNRYDYREYYDYQRHVRGTGRDTKDTCEELIFFVFECRNTGMDTTDRSGYRG
jgi:hypothetical protein